MSKPSRKAPEPPPSTSAVTRGRTLAVAALAVLGLAVSAILLLQSNSGESVPPPDATTTASAASAVSPPQASTPPQQPGAPAPTSRPTASTPAASPEAVRLKPHPQKDLPPLRFPGYPLGRSPEVIRAVYQFAAEHPEILTYVPCFCGCERGGHRGNEDCFVKARGANRDVVEWEEHGMECNVCIDVAQQAMQMYASGASVRDIRAAVEGRWAAQALSHTPTPHPPQ